jgi:threonine synthase
LLTDAEIAEETPLEAAQHAALRKPPVVLEAESDLVMHTLESHMKIPLPV